MRRRQFLTAAVAALLTFTSLHVFVGNRYAYGGFRGNYGFGPEGYNRPGCEPYNRYDDRQNNPSKPGTRALPQQPDQTPNHY